MDWQAFPELGILGFALLGLFIGSFLNVVIHRLPLMLEMGWKREAQHILASSDEVRETLEKQWHDEPAFNLTVPRSRCPHCNHQIRWFENIPVVSYLALRGRCSACKAKIRFRYPAVELLTAGLFAYCGWRFGWTPLALAWSGFCAALVCLTLIDFDTMLLPDEITLPLLWAGLILAALGLNPLVTLPSAVWGAAAGYLSLWTVYWLFKLIRGREGMGYGDFKLLAALGAWMGWQALLPIILVSSVVGAVIGLATKLAQNLNPWEEMPFGPYLCMAGLLTWIMGSGTIMQFVYRSLGHLLG